MLKRLRIICFLLPISFLCFNNLFAQTPLSTDRPDATEGSFVMDKLSVQVEVGYNKSSQEIFEDKIESSGFGSLIRVGLFENLELRLEIGNNKIESQTGEEISGLDPIGIGFKTNLKSEGKFCPEISFLGSMALAGTGAEEFQIDDHGPAFRFLLSKGINDIFSLGVNLGMEWSGESTEATSLSTLALGIALTKDLGTFVELESYYLNDAADEHILNFGATLWLVNDIQLDFSYGVGLSEVAIENQLTIGLSARGVFGAN